MGVAYIIIWSISKIPNYNVALRKYFWLFVIGMVSPDIERFITFIAQQIGNVYFIEIASIFTGITHSILGVILISLFITSFFPHEKDTMQIFLTLFIGGLGHLFLDMIMWPWVGMGVNFLPLNRTRIFIFFSFSLARRFHAFDNNLSYCSSDCIC